MNITNLAGKIELNFNTSTYTKHALEIYSSLNYKEFISINTPLYWEKCVSIITSCHNQQPKINSFYEDINDFISTNNKVVLAFSGGLDSLYQALWLRENNYDVVLLHVCNLNKYTNGQEKKAVIKFANDFNFPLELVNFKQTPKEKYWQENSFKTCLAYAICLDYCLENNISNISSGDDLRLSIKDAVPGVNLGDSKEITLEFFKNLPINFIPIQTQNKVDRLKLLDKYSARDYYYSCVNAGRLNAYLHDKFENKYNIKIDKHSCSSYCRKCSMHILLDYYYLNKKYPQEVIDKCWNTLSKGADNVFFDKKLPINIRVRNLIEY